MSENSSMKTVRTRAATVEDTRTIAEVHVAGWQWGYRGLLDSDYLAGLSVDPRVPVWREAIVNPELDVIVAEANGRVVGFVSVSPARDSDLPDHTGELLAIYILEEVAGTGVGATLLDTAEEAMRRRGNHGAALWVLESNERARGFYERHGWTPDGSGRIEGQTVTLREVRYVRRLRPDGVSAR
jgi:ribosomal protein S18 acetylase RimI-like enzyme